MIRQELVEKLESVSRALADNDIIPIFKCFCFDGQTVKAYNDALAIIAPCKTAEKFCVNGQILLGLLSNSHTENVEFSIGGQELTVKTGKSTFKLPWFPVADFLFKAPAETKFVCNITEDFVAGLSACLMTSSKDNSQAALMGVCLVNSSLYSTDGDAITRYGKPNKDGAGNMLPNSFCETLVKFGGTGMLSTNREWAKAKLDNGLLVYGRLIAVDNPIDYEMWVKKTIKDEPSYVEIPKGLDRALSRARVVADPESASTLLRIEGARMHLWTETSMGVVQDNLPYEDKILAVQANVSAELVQRCISLCNEMAVLPNCCCFYNGSGNKLFILTSNMGK
jgi:DNA polymerase III sliding clamp (beta) subunit (PCNA family)